MNSTQQTVVIVSPALADANNGNWQTARRWQQLLQSPGGAALPRKARIVTQWPDGPLALTDQCMLALHARRSADSVSAWANSRSPGHTDSAVVQPVPGLAVVLTGTDLYRDILTDPLAQRSLELAQHLVVLQAMGLSALPNALQARARVIFQSTPARVALPKPTRFLKALMVGHLREEKSPETLFAAARLLAPADAIRLDHIGAPLDAALADLAQATALICPNYRWLGGLPHNTTRRHMQRAHVLVHTSRMEGGAHVVMEAVRCATPVLASRIAGNVGMLGEDYAGYFDWNDASRLVALLRQCRDDAAFLAHLQGQCAKRAPLFSPQVERQALHALVDSLLPSPAA
ncbi:MAG: TIGR04348 family glycosyltransferase [Burkholderiales bacterium]|nr:TIGR04348 family glycosyltransferase [Burkholderiales bacterium]